MNLISKYTKDCLESMSVPMKIKIVDRFVSKCKLVKKHTLSDCLHKWGLHLQSVFLNTTPTVAPEKVL